MTQENNEEFALVTDVGSDGSLIVEQFLGFANRDVTDEEFEQVLSGQPVDGITAYQPGTYYKISADPTSMDYSEPFDIHIHFQAGPPVIDGINGATNESLLKILIHRTKLLDAKFPSEQNKQAIFSLQSALEAFNARTAERQERGVEGQQLG
ncbi:hypothetical protein EA770_07130 [Acinetobacter baumannii]|nr:hypothetical protein EA770_07130 [Acinetobacter baumannii]